MLAEQQMELAQGSAELRTPFSVFFGEFDQWALAGSLMAKWNLMFTFYSVIYF